MAKEKEDVLQANAGAPAADIPDLKKKDKERKKGGAAWSGARGAASEFSGATGGTVSRAAASAAASAAAEGAGLVGAESGGFLAGIARFVAGLTGTLLGKLAVAAAAFLMMAAAGLVGYALLKGNGAAVGGPNLGGIADSMHVRAGGDDRMGVNSRGELRFDPLSAAKKPAAAAPTDAKAASEAPAPAPAEKAAEAKPVPSGQLAHNMSGTSLSSSLGGGFGNKDIFAGNSAAPKFGAATAGLSKFAGSKGTLGAMKASTAHATASARSVKKGSANKAFGQLRLAKGLSLQGAGATSAEQASAAESGAFDQQQPAGGDLATNGAPGGDTPGSLGGGAPPIDTGAGPVPEDPCAVSGCTTDPGLQGAIAQISALADQAMNDMETGMGEIAAAVVLIAAGIALCCCATFWTVVAGIALILAGVALLISGIMMVQQANDEKAKAEDMAKQLGQSIGNKQQDDTLKWCTDWSVKTGQPMSACQPPDSVTQQNESDAEAAADLKKVHEIPKGSATVTP
jgi:hypothetical protein